jgi:hypothetical protein
MANKSDKIYASALSIQSEGPILQDVTDIERVKSEGKV